MMKLFSTAVLAFALVSAVASPALACGGAVHVPHCEDTPTLCYH